MSMSMTPEEIDKLARKRAGAKLGWYIHLAVYLAVNSLMFLVSSMGMGHRQWSLFPALGWGVGLLFHGISVFVLGGGSGLRERMVQKERERLLEQQQKQR